MNDTQFMVTAYIVALGLVLGYLLILWIQSQKLYRRKGREG